MSERVKVITFDIYQTIIRYGDDLIKEIGYSLSKYFNEIGYSVDPDTIIEYYRNIEHDVRVSRIRNMIYTPPMENVRRLIRRISQKYGIPMLNKVVADSLNIISDTVVNSQKVNVIEGVEEVFNVLKEEEWLIGVVSNVIFWPGRVSRALLNRFGLWRYIDYAVFSDEVGYPKPHPAIFDVLIDSLTGNRLPDVALHVGDNLQEDFVGALMYGIVGVLYDPEGVYIPTNVSPYEAMKCRAYVIKRTRDVLTLASTIEKCG